MQGRQGPKVVPFTSEVAVDKSPSFAVVHKYIDEDRDAWRRDKLVLAGGIDAADDLWQVGTLGRNKQSTNSFGRANWVGPVLPWRPGTSPPPFPAGTGPTRSCCF